jgi:glycosyltransferase involved in cell wall biosynthesis
MSLAIIILSYNRPSGVERILKHFLNTSNKLISIIIKDDKSPDILKIKEIYEFYKNLLEVPITLHENSVNLGYDGNLIDSFYVTDSDYVFLLSDDDYLNAKNISETTDMLEKKEFDFYFTPYVSNGVALRNPVLNINKLDYAEFIYNSILFSGLIFRRSAVIGLNYDYNFLSNSIYSQVYLALNLFRLSGDFGVAPSNLLVLGGDGENFFGKNQAAKNNHLLSDRKKITSNLIYQQFLLNVVKKFSDEYDKNIYDVFWRAYTIRIISYGLKVRSQGFGVYLNFLKEYFKKNTKGDFYISIALLVTLIVPSVVCERIYAFGVKRLRRAG